VVPDVSYRNDVYVPNLSSNRQSSALVSLGQAIRRARKEQNLSQESLALLAEVDTSYLGRVERGDNNVAMLTLVKIAQALNVTVTQLMTDAGL
jgi:transcriptional regulator with XRE-family HTH domain